MGQGDAGRNCIELHARIRHLLTFVEFFGGICITSGMFTRFFAAAAAIEMGYLTFIYYWGNGTAGAPMATNT